MTLSDAPHQVSATEACAKVVEPTVTSRLTDLSRRLAELASGLVASCATLEMSESAKKPTEATVEPGSHSSIARILSICEEELSRAEGFAGEISRQL